MARLTAERLLALRTRHGAGPRICVESGTYRGKTTRLALAQFPVVHTIELNLEWYAAALRELAPLGAHCHWANSAQLVPILAARIEEPVFWYLDAHWFALVPDVAGKEEGLPLWAELEAIAKRDHKDVIVVDDVHSFGATSPTPEWLDVSLDRIASYFPHHIDAVILDDQAAVYR